MNKFYLSLIFFIVAIAAGCSSTPPQPVANNDVALNSRAMQLTMSATSFDRRLKPSADQLAAYRSGALGDGGPSPVLVDLRDVAQAAPQSANSADLVAAGADIESPFSKAQIAQAMANAMAQGPQSGVNILPNGEDNLDVNNNGKGKGNGKKGPKLFDVIDSIGAEDCCTGVPFTATVPPDSEMTVGPNHMIATVNVSLEIYDKAGNVLIPAIPFGVIYPLGVVPFDACSGGFPFDPDVVYDESTDRFIIGYDGGGAFYCMLTSVGSDPFSFWLNWFDGSNALAEFFDFPHMGVGADEIFIGSNQFGAGFLGGAVFAVDKASLYAGTPPALAVVRQDVPRFDSTPQPANSLGEIEGTFPTSGPHYIMTEVFDGIHHSVYSWDDPFGANTFSLEGDVDLAAASGVPCPGFACFPVPVTQAGSAVTLAGNDFRGQETKYRNGSLWTAQTVSCNPGSGVVNCIRWAEIDPTGVIPGPVDGGGFLISATTDGVVQAGVFSSDDGNHRWFPSLTVNMCGDMAIGYSKSGPGIFPSVAITGRRHTDLPGFVRSEVDVIGGSESYRSFQDPAAPNRWGDYSGMAMDPNGVHFWHLGEYAGPSSNVFANWQNVISKSKFGCSLEDIL